MRGKLAEAIKILPDLSLEAAEHDEVFFGSEKKAEDLTPEEVKALDDLGISWDEEFESWRCFT